MASAITAVSAASQASIRTRTGVVRRSEWVVLGFLLYAQALSLSLPVAATVQFRVLTWNSAALMGYVPLLYFDTVVLANSDLIGKLGVVLFPSGTFCPLF
jgi:hypothetical protein